jgi:cysteinyl-tRNA synthetase
MRTTVLATLAVAMLVLLPGCLFDDEDEVHYRSEMRKLVEELSAYAHASDSTFIVVPQNGHEMATKDGEPDGELVEEYLAAIDGVGREDLFYGYDGMDVPTPVGEREPMLAFMDRFETAGVEVLVTDYCTERSLVYESIQANVDRGYIAFVADSLELDRIPSYPAEPYHVNADNVTTLAEAQNFLYLINPEAFEEREDLVAALRATNFDVLIIDAFFNGSILNNTEVASLKVKANGGTRLVISYMSVGEAEDYRYYWNVGWDHNRPSWMAGENPDWDGNYKVRYWKSEWKAVLFGSPDAYLDRVIDAGFDGVYLDLVDAYEYFE